MQPPPPPIVPSRRPKVLIAAAIICFVVGAFYCLGIFGALMSLRDTQIGPMPGMDDAMVQVLQDMSNEPHLKAVQLYGGLVGTVIGGLMIASGVGLLKCRDWARKVTVFCGLYIVAASLVGTYVTFKYTLPMMERLMSISMKAQSAGKVDAAAADMASKFGSIAASVSAVAGVGLALAIAITLIVLVTRPQAKAACRGGIA